MKKLLLVGFLLISSLAYSQVEKGDMNLTFGGIYTGNEVSKAGVIYAKAGYFITQNIEAGVQPTFILGDFGGFGLGLYGTYNLLTSNAEWLPYGGLRLDFLSFNGDFKYSQVDLGAYIGAKYFLSEVVNIDGNFSVSPNISNSEDVDLGTTVRFTIGIGFIIGGFK